MEPGVPYRDQPLPEDVFRGLTGQISVSAPANGILAVDVIAVTLHLDC
jgi:hypothetical protein